MSTYPAVPSFPPVDARLVEPESGLEVVRGEVVVTAAKFPHARPQARLAALLETHVGDDWVVATELTSRVAEDSDFAPDVSIRPRLADPELQDHIIDEVAFEVVNTQRRTLAIHKAEDLVTRGVRRVFLVDVPRQQVLEWTPSGPVEVEGAIRDRTLDHPLPVDALLGFGSVKDEVAEALLAHPPPVVQVALRASLDRGRSEGEAQGKVQACDVMRRQVLARLRERGLPLSDEVRAILQAPASLETWVKRLGKAESVECADDLV